MGMQLFGPFYITHSDRFLDKKVPRWNFTDFMHSFMVVFRVLCGEWIETMWDCLLVAGWPCIPFFLATVIIGNLVVSINPLSIEPILTGIQLYEESRLRPLLSCFFSLLGIEPLLGLVVVFLWSCKSVSRRNGHVGHQQAARGIRQVPQGRCLDKMPVSAPRQGALLQFLHYFIMFMCFNNFITRFTNHQQFIHTQTKHFLVPKKARTFSA